VQRGDRATILHLPEEMTDADEPILNGWTCGAPRIILDFGAVRMMNGLGALTLAKLCTAFAGDGQRVLAVSVNEHYRDVLRVTGLDRGIEVHDTREQAWAPAGLSEEEMTFPHRIPEPARDVGCWARPISRLHVPPMPPQAMNLNVHGLRLSGALDGFGRLWQKTYGLRIRGLAISPEEAMAELKGNFTGFQAPFNRFFVSEAGIRPGAIVLIDSSTPGGPLSTGVMVLFADERCFSLITPQGHPEAGWMTFRAFQNGETPTVQIVGFGRASDPLYELAYRAAGSRVQVRTWTHVLASLADHLGVQADISVEQRCVGPSVQWSHAGNVWHNAQVRTLIRWLRVRRPIGRTGLERG
jgi:anti-anti-sigma regulatory factor